ncbi:MAG: polymer-forming cytoskeletal protein [Anaerolineae bacterium]
MSFFRSGGPRPATEKIENVIGSSADFRGDLKTEGGIRIDGVFEGTVESQSNVIIGENARVVADVAAFNITVAGLVEGNITAFGRLEILATGRVVGDVQAGALLIEDGGVFQGQSLMTADQEATHREKIRSPEPAALSSDARQEQSEKETREDVSQKTADTAAE